MDTGAGRAAAVIEAAIARRVFPTAVAEVGTAAGVAWHAAHGRLSFDPAAPSATVDTIFDLASLTKPLVTTQVLLGLLAAGRLALDDRVMTHVGEWKGSDREPVTIRDLMEHAGGLPARLLDRPPSTRREFEHDICSTPLEYAPRERSLYSDLGFILLGFLAADAGGTTLDRLFAATIAPLGSPAGSLNFAPIDIAPVAPTRPLPEDLRSGRILVGEVHDNYASALGGVAGHAGLFGAAAAVGAVARAILRAFAGDRSLPPPFTRDLVELAATRSQVPGSSRALGWDTMLPSSSCGTRMSPRAIGHVGFTGTSLWIDPGRDRYFVLLTNRACGGGTIDEMRGVRRAFHDAAADL